MAEEEEQDEVSCVGGLCHNLGCAWEGSDERPNLREGVLKNRACTDVPWLFALFLCIGVIYGIVIQPAIDTGDFDKFTGAQDYQKNICGQGDMEHLPVGAWPSLTTFDFVKCVETCDATEDFTIGYSSYEFLYWCIPTTTSAAFEEWDEAWGDDKTYRMFMDAYENMEAFGVGAGITCGLLAAYFIILLLCTRVIFYFIGLAVIMGTSLGAVNFLSAGTDDMESFAFGMAFLIVGLLFIAFLACCWGNFDDVFEVIEESCKAMFILPEVLLTPIFSLPIVVGILIAWLLLTMVLYSIGSYDTETIPSEIFAADLYLPTDTDFYQFAPDLTYRSEIWGIIFWAYWSLMFMQYLNFFIISGCVADWYLDKMIADDEQGNEADERCQGITRYARSVWRAIRYHLGTIAFASLIMAILQTVESMFAYMQSKLEDQGSLVKMVLCCVQCVLRCVACIVDKFNQGTLVMSAVLGQPFCGACCGFVGVLNQAFGKITLGMGMISMLIWVGNFGISALATAFVGFGYFEVGETNDVESKAIPLLLCFVMCFFLTRTFLSVWETSCTTILVCLVLIEEYYPEKGVKAPEMRKNANAIESNNNNHGLAAV